VKKDLGYAALFAFMMFIFLFFGTQLLDSGLNWAIGVFFFRSLNLFNEAVIFSIFLGLIIFFGLRMDAWTKRAKAKREQKSIELLGQPQNNLCIKLVLETTTFNDGLSSSAIDSLEKWGLAINFAKTHILGNRHLTEKGFLLPGHVADIPCQEAILVIDENVRQLIAMKDLLENNQNQLIPELRPHFHYVTTKELEFVDLFKGYLYVPARMEGYTRYA